MADKININRFAEAWAAALTAQLEKQYPGIQIKVKEIKKKENAQCA